MIDITNSHCTDINISDIQFCYLRKRNGDWSFNMKSKPNYGFIFIKSGTLTIERNEKIAHAKKGDLIFLPKNGSHTVKHNSSSNDRHCSFYTVSFYGEASDDFFINDLISLSHYDKFDNLFDELHNCTNNMTFGFNLKAKRILYDIIYNVSKEILHANNLSPMNANIQKAIRYINDNYMNKITLDDLSRVSGYSKSYFKKVFLTNLGTSPHRYIMDLRVEQAKTMLDSDMFSFKEIAQKCGFTNEYYFSTAFKKRMGCSPKNFR